MSDPVEITVVQQTVEVAQAPPPVEISVPAQNVRITPKEITVQISRSEPVAEIIEEPITVNIDLQQGPRGVPGVSPAAITVTAPTDISGHRVVAFCLGHNVIEYADHRHIAHAGTMMGVTLNAATAGNPITVVLSGDIVELSWNWTPGLVFLGQEGHLTQTAPTTGFIRILGTALTATRLVLQQLDPILL